MFFKIDEVESKEQRSQLEEAPRAKEREKG